MQKQWRSEVVAGESAITMAINVIRCTVSGASVSRVTDLEGRVTQLFCPEYEPRAGTCRIRRTALDGGPLAQLFERVSEDTLGRRGICCDLC